MSTVHWVAFPPERQDLQHSLNEFVANDDVIVLVDAGLAYLHHANTKLPQAAQYYALDVEQATGDWQPINEDELAELSLQQQQTICWYP